MFEDRSDRCLHPRYYARARTEFVGTVFLKKNNISRKLSVEVDDISRSTCLNRFIKWTKIPLHTLDIALFDVLHKDVVNAIIRAQRNGVRCRIILYKYMMIGKKRAKYISYVDKLQKAGVLIHYMHPRAMPYPPSRLFLIDAVGPSAQRPFFVKESGAVIGDQVRYTGGHTIMHDFLGLLVAKEPPTIIIPWLQQFESMWEATNIDEQTGVPDVVEASTSGAGTAPPPRPASPTGFLGWLRKMI